jgi:hypothetical protein
MDATLSAAVPAGICERATGGSEGMASQDPMTKFAELDAHKCHTMRHFFASWCINREKDGGLRLPAKVVQERPG